MTTWREQPHTHCCPIHNDRTKCDGPLPCPRPYIWACPREHPQAMLQEYIDRARKRANEDARDYQREARDAYQAGQEDYAEREKQGVQA